MSWEILLLGLFGAIAWYWYAGMLVREQAVAVGRRACVDAGLQFLDESVALSRTRFARNGWVRRRLTIKSACRSRRSTPQSDRPQ